MSMLMVLPAGLAAVAALAFARAPNWACNAGGLVAAAAVILLLE